MSEEGTYAPKSPDLASFFQSQPEDQHQLHQHQQQQQQQHHHQQPPPVSPSPQNINWYHAPGGDQSHSRSYSYSALSASAQSPTGPAFSSYSSYQPLSATTPSYTHSPRFSPHQQHQQLQSHPQSLPQSQPQPQPHSQPQQPSFYFPPNAAVPHQQHAPAHQQPTYQQPPYPQHQAYQQQGYPQPQIQHDVQPYLKTEDPFHHQQIKPDFPSDTIKSEDDPEDSSMPPRRSAAAAAAAAEAEAAGMMESPVKTKFPTARIKRIMQADEEVGKVAQQTPIAVGKALELFMVQLVTKSAEVAREKNSKRVTAAMLKTVVEADDQWDFLRDIVSKVEHDKDGSRAKAAKNESSDTEEEAEPKKRRGGRKKKAA